MAYQAKIIEDSVNKFGNRLTTFEVTFPRIVLAELNTHRMFSRNSASSRAIPVEKMINRVIDDPFIPIHWGKNQPGMKADEQIGELEQAEACRVWLEARNGAVRRVKKLIDVGVHKQIANRLLEPFLWHTTIITATEYGNFFNQRCHPDAQPEIRKIAEMMKDLYFFQEPYKRAFHLPYIQAEDCVFDLEILKKVSVARCARVSYLTHDGKRDIEKDIELHNKLITGQHMSPFEHVATADNQDKDKWYGNFKGWVQYRKRISGENRSHYTVSSGGKEE